MPKLTDAEARAYAAEIRSLIGDDGPGPVDTTAPTHVVDAPDPAYAPEANLDAFFSRWLPEAQAMVRSRWSNLDDDGVYSAAMDLLTDFIASGQLAAYDPRQQAPWVAYVRQRLTWAVHHALTHWLVDAFAHIDDHVVLADDDGPVYLDETDLKGGEHFVRPEAPEDVEREGIRRVWMDQVAEAMPADLRPAWYALCAASLAEAPGLDDRGVVDLGDLAAVTGLSAPEAAAALSALRFASGVLEGLKA
jgi:hypothetical protein